MGCCGGQDLEETSEGVVVQRKCRDILCLLLFIVFWAGMFVVCGIAYQSGNINRLVYGIDSFGFACGTTASLTGGSSLDLTSNINLYYLNPLDLMSITNIPYAKTICVKSCPGANTCSLNTFPCTNVDAFMCPYYKFANQDLFGTLPGVPANNVAYYNNLTLISGRSDAAANTAIQTMQSLNIAWINSYLTTYSISGTGPVSGRFYQLSSQIPGRGPCYPVYVPTTAYFHRCFPEFTADFTQSLVSVANSATNALSNEAKDSFNNNWNSLSNKFTRYVGDISKGILIIVVAGLLGGFVMSVIWLVILRYFAGFMAWATIILVNVILVGITIYCFSMAGMLGNSAFAQGIATELSGYGDPTVVQRSTWKWIAIAAACVAGLVFLVTLLMISRIKVAVACIKVASQAVGSMPSILFFPLIPFILLVGLVVYWVSVTAMLYTAGTLTANCRAQSSYEPFSLSSLGSLSTSTVFTQSTSTTDVACYPALSGIALQEACGQDPNCYVTYSWDNKIRYAFIYHFFGLLWTNQFIVGISCVTIAGAIGSFYWAAGDTAAMAHFPVLQAMKNTFVYHLGSIAFGSLIIAIIQFIRFVLEYLDKKTRAIQQESKWAEWAMCCVKCCVWCLEKIVTFINRNAYIVIGLKGSNYCTAAGRAIALLVMNAMRLITVNVIGDVLLFLGKVAVAAGCGLIAFGMSDLQYYTNPTNYPDTYLSSPVFPVALSIIIGFVVAEIFFAVYDMAINTIFLAFCEDCERHDGNPKWAPALLMEAMGQEAVHHQHQPPVQPQRVQPSSKGNKVAALP